MCPFNVNTSRADVASNVLSFSPPSKIADFITKEEEEKTLFFNLHLPALYLLFFIERKSKTHRFFIVTIHGVDTFFYQFDSPSLFLFNHVFLCQNS